LLKDTSLAAGEREIRVWVGFGIVVPEKMLRLRINSNGVVSGNVYLNYPNDLENDEFLKRVLATCDHLKIGEEDNVCTRVYKSEPSWKSIYKNLLALNITNLPDQSELPAPDIQVNDGIAMVVEIRDGTSYRAYQYSNPIFRSQPEAVAASKIITIVHKVARKGT
jgi:tryptophan synthase alpha subunit